jgi:hypothetical protein
MGKRLLRVFDSAYVSWPLTSRDLIALQLPGSGHVLIRIFCVLLSYRIRASIGSELTKWFGKKHEASSAVHSSGQIWLEHGRLLTLGEIAMG